MRDVQADSEEKLRYKLKGQSRPFVDGNLQIRIPGVEQRDEPALQETSRQKIYAHYASHFPPLPSTHPSLLEEMGLKAAMRNAAASHAAWRELTRRILKTIGSQE